MFNLSLEDSSTKTKRKYACPACRQKNKFTKYINRTTGEYVSDLVGKCDRENNCGYHFTPKQYFCKNGIVEPITKLVKAQPSIVRPVQFLPADVFLRSVDYNASCNLFPFLARLFTDTVAHNVCSDYFIGADSIGDTVFWQVDLSGNIRQAKVIRYDAVTGKRNKATGAFFAGKKILRDASSNLKQCFFGEYLLSMHTLKNFPVAIVESEKTAVIGHVYFPNYIWLATGGKHGCRWTDPETASVLKGRKVVLFPDLGAYDAWYNKGLELSRITGTTVKVSSLLERNATDAESYAGLDLADYLLRHVDSTGLALSSFDYPIFWDR